MNCNETDQIFRLYDGRLTGEKRAKAERHLEHCAQCRAALREWKATAGRFFSCSVPEEVLYAQDTAERVMFRIETEEKTTQGFLRRLRTYATLPRLALAGALAAATIFLLWPAKTLQTAPGTEGTAFAVELVSARTADTSSYTKLSEQLFGL